VSRPTTGEPLSDARPRLGARILRLRTEFGLGEVLAIAWSRGWMAFAGVPVVGRVAVRLAAAGCRPFYGRHRLARYHRRGFVAPGARLSHPGLECGANVFIDDGVVILRDTGGGPVRLGDRVHLNEGVRIVAAHGGSVTLDDDAHIQPGCYFIAVKSAIRVGKFAQIAPNCAFYPYDHGVRADRPLHDQPLTSRGDIVVGDDAWLGYGVVVLSGTTIGAGAVIGAGSVVSGEIPPGAIAAGSPATVIRMRD
jgi:acetyltransferase-like isoleucine patch superfamily enzyme